MDLSKLSQILGIAGSAGAVLDTVLSPFLGAIADSRQLGMQKDLMNYQNDLQQQTNTFATQKGHAAAAGFSPALLYGNTPQAAQVSGGSSQGTPGEVSLGKIGQMSAFNNIYEAAVQKEVLRMQKERLLADVSLSNQKKLESAARTAELTRYTGLQKQLQQTIIDQSLANLAYTRSQSANLDFVTSRARQMLPYELEQAGLLNEQTAATTRKIVSDITKNRFEMAEIRANIGRISKLNELTDSQIANTDFDTARIKESIFSSALTRVMSEYGLNNIKIPPSMRTIFGDDFTTSAWYLAHKQQLEGAVVALLAAGFDPREAAEAVVFYVSDGKKNTGAVNAMSRVASALVLKK